MISANERSQLQGLRYLIIHADHTQAVPKLDE